MKKKLAIMMSAVMLVVFPANLVMAEEDIDVIVENADSFDFDDAGTGTEAAEDTYVAAVAEAVEDTYVATDTEAADGAADSESTEASENQESDLGTESGEANENTSDGEAPAEDSLVISVEEVEEADSPELTTVDVSELVSDEFYYTEYFADEDIRVTLTADEGVVPDGAEAVIDLVEGDDLEALKKELAGKTDELLADRIAVNGSDPSSIYYRYANLRMMLSEAYGLNFEITYTDDYGNLCVYEPEDGCGVTVQIESSSIEAANENEMQEVDLFHIRESTQDIMTAELDTDDTASDSAEVMTGQAEIEGNTIVFTAEHFSIYAFSVMTCSAAADEAMVVAEEKVWEVINSVDPDYFLDDPYLSSLTDAQYAELKSAAETAVSGCSTQYEKIQAITEYVSDRIYYDYQYYYAEDKSTATLYLNPYDVHTSLRTVCSGYARYTRTLLISLGIPCMDLIGDNHEYNAAYDSDSGSWVFTDTTWCSRNIYSQDGEWYYYGYSLAYFDMSTTEIAELSSHEVYYVSGLPDEDGALYYELGTDADDWTDYSKWYLCILEAQADASSVTAKESLLGYSVTEIAYGAFYGNTVLEQVDLSAVTSLSEIYDAAFFGCTGLKKVTFPANLTTIGTNAFYYCTSLQEADLSETAVETIGKNAFCYCSSLQEMDLSQTAVTVIIERTFYGCSALKTVSLPVNLLEIGDYAFYNCTAMDTLSFPSGLTTIGDFAFYNCTSLQNANFSGTALTTIGAYAFTFCSSLKTAAFSKDLTEMGDGAFYRCTLLEEADLSGTSLTAIGEFAFDFCTSLETVIFPSCLTEIGEDAFRSCTALETLSFPSGLTTIGDSAFYYCTGLSGLDLSSTKVTRIGEYAFGYCNALYKICLPSTVASIGDYAFMLWRPFGNLSDTWVATSLTAEQIRYTDSDKDVVWAGRAVTIAGYFYTIRFDGNGAEDGSMDDMTCGSTVTYSLTANTFTREGFSFAGWNTNSDGSGTAYSDGSSVCRLGGAEGSVVILYAQWTADAGDSGEDGADSSDGDDSASGSDQTSSSSPVAVGAAYSVGKASYTVTASGAGGSTVILTAPKNKNVTSITIPATVTIDGTTYRVTAVADSAFANCKKLKTVSIGANVTTIGKKAFYKCTKLTTVKGGKALTSIGASAFQGCTALKSFTCKSTKLKKIGKKAFYGDKKLATVSLKTKKLTKSGVKANAFKGIRSTCTFKVPSSKVSAYKKIFKMRGAGNKIKVEKL